MPRTVNRKNAYTTGDVAVICSVANKTAARWIDSGLLKGFLVC